jgi:MEDS: MEthanogen/methylotroph, DcmR Sensory domain
MRGDTARRFHAAHFFRDEDALAALVADFLIDGFTASQPAVVIASQRHLDRILEKLHEHSLDIDRLEAEHRLFSVEAETLLATIMSGGLPDAARVRAEVIPLIEQACAGRADCTVRLYGDLVNLLWNEGETGAALVLEEIWNDLTRERDVAVLCGYAMAGLYKRTAAPDYVLRFHTHLVSEDGEMSLVRK